MSFDLDAVRAALEEQRSALNQSPRAISLAATGKPDAFRKLVTEGVPPRADRLAALCTELGLEFYIGPPRAALPEMSPLALKGEDYMPVGILEDVSMSGGPGAFPGSEVATKTVAFRSEWLKRKGLSAQHAALFPVRGDSMTPHIRDGDIVLVDLRKRDATGHISMFRRGEDLFVKRLTRMDHGLMIESTKAGLTAEFVPKGEVSSTIEIIGRAVWSGGDIKADL